MASPYETLVEKINESSNSDEQIKDIIGKQAEFKALYSKAEALAPRVRQRYSSTSEFIKDLTAGSLSEEYFWEELDQKIEDCRHEIVRAKFLHEDNDIEKRQNLLDDLLVNKEELGKIYNDVELSRQLSNSKFHADDLKDLMKQRLRYIVRETIKANYYTSEVQEIFNSVQKNGKTKSKDELVNLINSEVEKFIAAREYQIPPREATLKK